MWPIKSLSAWLLIAKRIRILFVRRSIEFYTQWVRPPRAQDNSPARTPTGKMIWNAIGMKLGQFGERRLVASAAGQLTYFHLIVWNWLWQSLHQSIQSQILVQTLAHHRIYCPPSLAISLPWTCTESTVPRDPLQNEIEQNYWSRLARLAASRCPPFSSPITHILWAVWTFPLDTVRDKIWHLRLLNRAAEKANMVNLANR